MADITIADIKMKMDFDSRSFIRALSATKKELKSVGKGLDDVVSASDRVARTGKKLGAAKATALNTARKKAEALRAELMRIGAPQAELKKVTADFNRLANSILTSKKFAKDYNRIKQNLTSSIAQTRQATQKEAAVQKKLNFEVQKGVRGSKQQKQAADQVVAGKRRLTTALKRTNDSLRKYYFWKKKANKADEEGERRRPGTRGGGDEGGRGLGRRGRGNVGSAAVLAFGPLSGVGSRIIALNAIAGRFQPTLWGIVGAVSALATTMGALSIKAFDDYQTSLLKIQAVLRATSYSAGQTSQSVIDFSNKMALTTLASVQQMRDTSTAVLTFRGVASQNFKRVIRLAQDMSAVGFGTARNAAIQLSKALVDPAQGIASLRRVGVTFTETQREMIKLFQRTGQEAAAQNLILSEVESQLGGAAQAEALNTWAGKIDTIQDKWTLLRETIGENITTSWLGKLLQGFLDKMAEFLDMVEKWQNREKNAPLILGSKVKSFEIAQQMGGQKVLDNLTNKALPRVQKEIQEQGKSLSNLTAQLKRARIWIASLQSEKVRYEGEIAVRESRLQRGKGSVKDLNELNTFRQMLKRTQKDLDGVLGKERRLQVEIEVISPKLRDLQIIASGIQKIISEGIVSGESDTINTLKAVINKGFLKHGEEGSARAIINASKEVIEAQERHQTQQYLDAWQNEWAAMAAGQARAMRAEEERKGKELRRLLKSQSKLYASAGINQSELLTAEIPEISTRELQRNFDIFDEALTSSLMQKGVRDRYQAYKRNLQKLYDLQVQALQEARKEAIEKAKREGVPIELEPIDLEALSAHPKKSAFALLQFLQKITKEAHAARNAMQLLFDKTEASGAKAARALRNLWKDTDIFALREGMGMPGLDSPELTQFSVTFNDLESKIEAINRERDKHIERIRQNKDLRAPDVPFAVAQAPAIEALWEPFFRAVEEGEPERVIEAHRKRIMGALDKMEKEYQSRVMGGLTRQQTEIYSANEYWDRQIDGVIKLDELEKKLFDQRMKQITKEATARANLEKRATSRARLSFDVPRIGQQEFISRLAAHEDTGRRNTLEKELSDIRTRSRESRAQIRKDFVFRASDSEGQAQEARHLKSLLDQQYELEGQQLDAAKARFAFQEKIRTSLEGQLQAQRRLASVYLDEVEARSTETGSILDGIHMSIARAANTMRTDFQIAKDFTTMAIGDIASTFSNMLLDWDGNWKETLGNMFRRFSQWISEVLIKMALVRAASFFLGAPMAPGVGATGAGSVDISSPGASAALSPWYPGKASGGHASSGTYLVGERGPELIRFNRPGTVVPNNRLGEAMNGGGSRSGGSGTSIMFQPSYTINLGPGGMGDGANSGGRGKELAKTLDRAVQAKVTEVLLQQRRPGGLLAGPQDISTPGTVY